MIENPSCTDINQAKANASRLGVRLRRWVLYPLLALAGCHMLGTGSPVPLWHIERLDHPVGVKAVQDDALVLEDGRRVQLPFIKKLPKGDSAFDGALTHGVEVRADCGVFGLIEPTRMCGNDPVVYYRSRVNLSELAGFLNPDGIDAAIVDPAEIQELKERYSTQSRDRHGLPFDVMARMRSMRRIYEAAMKSSREEPVVIHLYQQD